MDPPTASDNVPMSPSVQTQYSLNIDALGLDESEAMSPTLQARIDKITSDEIDGPSDFTINMGNWLRNGRQQRGADPWAFSQSRQDTLHEENVQDDVATEGVPETHAVPSPVHEDATDDGLDRASETGSLANSNGTQDLEEGADMPNDDSMLDDMTNGSFTPRQPEESSIWEPQNNSSSLRSFRPRSLLQPTVEDYYSELTPARPLSAMNQPTFHLTTPDPPRRTASASKLHHPSPLGRASSPTLSPSRSPVANRKERVPVKGTSELQRLRTDVEDAIESQLETQKDSDAVRAQLDGERYETKGLRTELARTQTHQQKVEQTSESVGQSLRRQIAQLTEELNSVRRSEQDALQTAEQMGVKLNGIGRAEQEARQLAQEREKELDQMHESEDAELQDTRWQLQRAQDAEQAATTALEDLRGQMEDQGRAHDDEVQRLGRDLAAARSDAHQANDAEQAAQEELRLLRQQRNEHATALRDETQRLRQELDEAHRQEENARSETDRYYNELNDLKTSQEPLTKAPNESDSNDHAAQELRQSLEKQLHDAKAQIAKITQKHNTERETAAKRLRDAQSRVENLVTELNTNQSTIQDELRETKAQLANATQAHKTEQEVSERKLRDVQTQITRISQEREADNDRSKNQITDTEARIAAILRDNKSDKQARETAEEEIRGLKKELDVLRKLSALNEQQSPKLDFKEFDELNSGYDNALKLADSLRSEMEGLRCQMQAQQTQHDTEMDNIRSHLVEQRTEHRRTIDLIEEGMASIRHDRETLTAQVSTLENELSTAQQELEAMKDVNEAFDIRLSEILKKREDSWRVKLKEAQKKLRLAEDRAGQLDGERAMMAKALLVQWGREEEGVEERRRMQRFAYQFAKA